MIDWRKLKNVLIHAQFKTGISIFLFFRGYKITFLAFNIILSQELAFTKPDAEAIFVQTSANWILQAFCSSFISFSITLLSTSLKSTNSSFTLFIISPKEACKTIWKWLELLSPRSFAVLSLRLICPTSVYIYLSCYQTSGWIFLRAILIFHLGQEVCLQISQ